MVGSTHTRSGWLGNTSHFYLAQTRKMRACRKTGVVINRRRMFIALGASTIPIVGSSAAQPRAKIARVGCLTALSAATDAGSQRFSRKWADQDSAECGVGGRGHQAGVRPSYAVRDWNLVPKSGRGPQELVSSVLMADLFGSITPKPPSGILQSLLGKFKAFHRLRVALHRLCV